MRYIVCLVLIIGSAKCNLEHGVQISHNLLPNGNVLLRCSATGRDASRSVIQLGCNVESSGICRENCIQPCPIVDGKSDCSGVKIDAIVGCVYKKTSTDSFEVAYEIASKEDGAYSCNFRGFSSPQFNPAVYKSQNKEADGYHNQILEGVSGSRKMNRQSIEEPKEDTKNADGGKGTLLTPDIIFIITICAVFSCIFNIISFTRCMMTRNYINELTAGGPRKNSLERCLCIKELAQTYRRAPGFTNTRLGTNEQGYRDQTQEAMLGIQNKLVYPLTDPMPRRAPLQMMSFDNADRGLVQASCNHLAFNKPVLRGSFQNSEDLIYDDVHPSTACMPEVDLVDTQNMNFAGIPSTPQSARKCIVDQDGTVYVAMGQVSPEEVRGRGGQFGSKATLISTGEPQTPKGSRQSRESQNRLIPRSPGPPVRFQGCQNGSGHTTPSSRIRASQGMPPIYPTSGITAANYSPRIPAKNQELRSLPEESGGGGGGSGASGRPTRKMNSVPTSHISSISAPIPFADYQYVDDNDFDDVDPFEMGENTLLPSKRGPPLNNSIRENWNK